MNGQPIPRAAAQEYAAWFRILADATRVQIVSVLARGAPMSVTGIVAAVGVSQSTVSQHLKVLAATRLVLAERRGTTRLYRLDMTRMPAFPSAADVMMGRPAAAPGAARAVAPGVAPGVAPATAPGVAPAPGDAVAAREAMTLREMRAADAEQVLAIYQAGLDAGDASFETEAPSWAAFDAAKLPSHRHVAVGSGGGPVRGWVAVSSVSSRRAYAGVVEHSVYVDPRACQRGVGFALLNALISSTEAAGIWTIQSGIFPENTASLRLHERAGFRVVGIRDRPGSHHGRWRDVVLVERRSASAESR
ncbi:MAG TPA: metalloregulator ArsR/SmtB family transcription factor [Streptosporangiaceae bacterium]|nr:metalloregulator ArsR/SmtB family transcription factor [Streptosporangiaceae bacterium]